jgi:hypothetical protein
MEALKAMFHYQNLPKHLWAEATRNAMYVQSIKPHHVLGSKTPKEIFTREKLEVNHLRIFGFPIYVYVPKDKRSKLDPSGKKAIFFGYSETSKAYGVYILGHKHVDISRDVTFDDHATFKNSRKFHIDEDHDEESIAPRVADMRIDIVLEEHDIKYHDMEEPQIPTDPPREKKRKSWACEIIQDVEKYSAPEGTYRERKKPKTYSNCMALLSDIIDTEPTCYEKAIENKEWKDVMIEEYESILKNYVWDVVPVDYYSCMRHPPGHRLIEMT